ncbi:hypothetical protein [Oricola indica]|uniref:hypothetical protein n=1 Tax=Oricola indica TaxID=2872591 RepID=UPI003CCBB09C
MKVPESTLRAAICVPLKSASKDVRKAFGDKNWQTREEAERAIAELVMKGLSGFDISMKPAKTPTARSVQLAEQQLREVFPDHDPDEAMAVVRKTVQ